MFARERSGFREREATAAAKRTRFRDLRATGIRASEFAV